MQEKKKQVYMKRSYRYARDYKIEPDGEVRYIGPLYEFLEKDCGTQFRRFALRSGIAAVLMVLCGLLPVLSMKYSAFVIFPYGLGLVLSFVLLIACVGLVRAPNPMERRSFDLCYTRAIPVSIVTAFACAVAFGGHLVYILTHLQLGVTAPEVIFGVSLGFACALCVLTFQGLRVLHYKSYSA